MKIQLARVFFFVFFFVTSAYADVVLESKNQNITLLNLPYYEDKTSALSLLEVQKKQFSPNTQNIASFVFSASSYWFKITVKPGDDAQLHKWWLHVAYPLLDELDLYICDEKDRLIHSKKAEKHVLLVNVKLEINTLVFNLTLQKIRSFIYV